MGSIIKMLLHYAHVAIWLFTYCSCEYCVSLVHSTYCIKNDLIHSSKDHMDTKGVGASGTVCLNYITLCNYVELVLYPAMYHGSNYISW